MDGQDNIYFHTEHTSILCSVSKKTIYRWRKDHRIKFEKDMMSGVYLHPLSSINDIRQKKVMNRVSYDEAIDIIEDFYKRKEENEIKNY